MRPRGRRPSSAKSAATSTSASSAPSAPRARCSGVCARTRSRGPLSSISSRDFWPLQKRRCLSFGMAPASTAARRSGPFSTLCRTGRFGWSASPPYSPELNADEQVWNHLKAVLLKNVCAHNLKELESNVKYAMELIEESPELIRSFFRHPEVGFY